MDVCVCVVCVGGDDSAGESGQDEEMALYSHQTAAHQTTQYSNGWCASMTAGKEKVLSEFPVSSHNSQISATFPPDQCPQPLTVQTHKSQHTPVQYSAVQCCMSGPHQYSAVQ
jgi:type II secretory pathway component PulJ